MTFNAIIEVTNYNPCNFIIQCTNKQHNPPFITPNHIFKTQLNVWRDLSKTKPDVVFRVFSKPNHEECAALARFVCVYVYVIERVCAARRKGSRGRGVHYCDGSTRRVAESWGHTLRQARRSAASSSSGVCGGMCETFKGVCVPWVGVRLVRQQGALLCCQTQSSSVISGLSLSPPASIPVKEKGGVGEARFEITFHTGWHD